MLNLSRVVNNPRFTQTVTVYRQTGSYVNGRWTPGTSQQISMQFVIVTEGGELTQVPEGDRNTGKIIVHSAQAIYDTNSSGTSDQVTWKGNTYRLMNVSDYSDYGYYKGEMVRMNAT